MRKSKKKDDNIIVSSTITNNMNNTINDKNSIFSVSDNSMIFYNNVFTSEIPIEKEDTLVITQTITIDKNWKLLTPEEVGELYKDD